MFVQNNLRDNTKGGDINMIQIKDRGIIKKIEEDKKHFEEIIGGEQWTDEDVLKEWIKILNSLKRKYHGY